MISVVQLQKIDGGGSLSPTSSHNENPEGDRLFLEMLYESYNRLMFHQASRYFQNQTDIEDVVQQAFIKLMRYIPTLKKTEPKHFGGIHR